jgi:hypothetical protein
MQGCNFSTIVNNATCLTVGGSGGNAVVNSNFTSGTASAISIGSALTITNSTIGSSNTNAITGAGTIQYTGLSYSSTSSLVNTTTKSALNTHLGGLSFNVGVNTISSFTENTWTPTLALATPGTSSFTYTAQVGRYWQLGNFVWISARVILSNFTIGSGSGNVLLASLPFTIANVTNQNPVFSVWMQNVTTDALVLWYQGSGTPGQANMTFNGTKSASAVIQLAAASLANTSQFIISGCYSLA